jgi:hypothetical protein
VPQREVQEIGLVHAADSRRLCPPRLLDRGRPAVQEVAEGRRHDRRALAPVERAQQAEYDAIAEKIAWSNSRVAAFSQYLLIDDPQGGKPGSSVNGGTIGFQTGLEYLNGKPKPLYFGFPVPLTVTKSGHSFSLWGLVRPAAGATKVTVLVQSKGSSKYKTLKTVTTNGSGYWTLHSSTQGAHWRVRWVSPTGVKYEGPPIGAH